MKKRRFSVILTTILIFLNVMLWVALGIIGIITQPAFSVPPQLNAILAGLSLGMAGVLLVLFVLMHRGHRNAYYLTIAFFAMVSLLTIFGDVGDVVFADILVLALNLIPIVLLIVDRKRYLTSQSEPDKIV